MSKAEEKMLEHFPNEDKDSLKGRFGFLLGYHQAEKDLELTWEDIRKIEALCFRVDRECDLEEKEYYQEVLKRFKDLKK